MFRKTLVGFRIIFISNFTYADSADVADCVTVSKSQPALSQFSKQQITRYCKCVDQNQSAILEQAGNVSGDKMADMLLSVTQKCMVKAEMITQKQAKQAKNTYKKGNTAASNAKQKDSSKAKRDATATKSDGAAEGPTVPILGIH